MLFRWKSSDEKIKEVRLMCFSACVLLEIIGSVNAGLNGLRESGEKGKSQAFIRH